VRVNGAATASILPSPSLTFTDVEVGEGNGAPMMTIKRFAVTIELVPLLQGEIHVVGMRLEEPEVRLALDDHGQADWLKRSEASRSLDPGRVVLDDVEISSGRLIYSDARGGITKTFEGVNATLDARSLLGPWRVEGSYREQDAAVPFHAVTGIVAGDGSLRVKADFSPRDLPFAVSTDGTLAIAGPDGPAYRGSYNVTEIATGGKDSTGAAPGLRSDGMFAWTPGGLAITDATVAFGPADKATTVTGALTWPFANGARFTAALQARQLDLDRALGGGPSEPANVARAEGQLIAALQALPKPSIPGTLTFTVPGIVVGGSLIQEVNLAASASASGWAVDQFHAKLPGQAMLDVVGKAAGAASPASSIKGTAHLVVAQPATFATWLRGRAQDAGRSLPAFDLSGDIEIAPTRLAVDKAVAKIGGATISGSFYFEQANGERTLGTNLMADRIDFDAVKSIADLLLGANWSDTTGLADTFQIVLGADAFTYQDFAFKNVAINAAYTGDVLTVTRVAAGYDGGSASINGRLESVKAGVHGRIDAKLDATSLDVPARLARSLAPASGLANWLQVAAPALVPASLTAVLTAPADGKTGGLQLRVGGSAGGTRIVDLTGVTAQPGDWRSGALDVSAKLEATTSGGLIRQIGLAAVSLAKDVPASVAFTASGVPSKGLDAKATLDVAGVNATANGKLSVGDDLAPAFAGSIDLKSANLDLGVALAGLSVPGAAVGTSAKLSGDLALDASGASLKWNNAAIAGDRVSGAISLAPADRVWRIAGNIDADDIDAGWLMALGLGFPPTPTGDASAPWSKTPFVGPVYGAIAGKVAVTAAHLAYSDQLDLKNARFDLTLQPQRMDVDLAGAAFAGGTATGAFAINNVGGNAVVSGRLAVSQAALDGFVWRLDGRAVATGRFDLSANFEASGRSPAGLIASATGGGVLSLSAAEARYVNPGAARVLVRASDLGQQYTTDALRQAFGDAIAGDSLKFGRADAAFMIAAGTLRFSDVSLRAPGLEANVNAVVDLNGLSLNSDWTLAFDASDAVVQGNAPRAGLVFNGPLAAPKRTIDVLPLAAYLNQRREARMLDVIALQDATRLEVDRLTLLTRRIGEDDARRAAAIREAADRETRRKAAATSANAAVMRLHDIRDAAVAKAWVAGWKAYADRLAGEATLAQRAADAARRAVDAQKAIVDSAQAALTRAIGDERVAALAADAAGTALANAISDMANADVRLASANAATATPPAASVDPAARTAADAAARTLVDRTTADTRARVALVNAQLARATAQASVEAANSDAARVTELSRNTSRDAGAKSSAAMTARQAADKAAANGSPYDIRDAAAAAFPRAG
jgi:hypothetical protein